MTAPPPVVVVGDATLPAELAEDRLRDHPDITIPPGRWGLEPYPPVEFARLLAAALAVPGLPASPVFCDIGAGAGAKVLLAQDAGCTAWGVEAVPQYVAVARQLGADVRLGEAEDGDYSRVDVAYVNCPYRDPELEDRFERRIRGGLRGGCVLISVNHHHPPAGWTVVTEEPQAGRGVYVKPRQQGEKAASGY